MVAAYELEDFSDGDQLRSVYSDVFREPEVVAHVTFWDAEGRSCLSVAERSICEAVSESVKVLHVLQSDLSVDRGIEFFVDSIR